MSSSDTFEQAKKSALAVLTKEGIKQPKVPDPKSNYAKFKTDMAKLSKEFDTGVDQIQSKILAMQQQCQTVKAALKMYQDQIAKDNFNIPKDVLAKSSGSGPSAIQMALEKARGILNSFAVDKQKTIDNTLKDLDGLEDNAKKLEKYDADT